MGQLPLPHCRVPCDLGVACPADPINQTPAPCKLTIAVFESVLGSAQPWSRVCLQATGLIPGHTLVSV